MRVGPYKIKKLSNLCLIVFILTIVINIKNPVIADVIFFDDFSDGEMNDWTAGDENLTNGLDYWGVVDDGLYHPQVWCSGTSDGGSELWDHYDSNIKAYMKKTFDLYMWKNLELKFDYFLAPNGGSDFFAVKVNDQEIFRTYNWFDWDGQPKTQLDLSSFDGKIVELEFVFQSDSVDDGYSDYGAFLDNIELVGDNLNLEPSGEYIWVPNLNDDTVCRVDTGDFSKTVINVGHRPSSIVVDKEYVWVNTDGLTRIDKTNLSKINGILEYTPEAIAVDDTYVWGVSGRSNVLRIRKCDFQIENICEIDGVASIAVDDKYVWVGSYVFDSEPLKILTKIKKSDLSFETIEVGYANSTIGIDDEYVYLKDDCPEYTDCTISRLSKDSLGILSIDVGHPASAIAVDQSYIWVSSGLRDKVTRIDKNTFLKEIIDVGDNPHYISLDNDYVWVPTKSDDSVTRINKNDLSTNRFPVGDFPIGNGDMTGCLYEQFFEGKNSISGRVISRHWPHEGVPGVNVVADSGESTITDNFGQYELWDVPSGAGSITVSKTGYWAEGTDDSKIITYTIGGDVSCIDFDQFGTKGIPVVSLNLDDDDNIVFPGQTINITVSLKNSNYFLSNAISYLDLSLNEENVTILEPENSSWDSIDVFPAGYESIWAISSEGVWSQITSSECLISAKHTGVFDHNQEYSFTVPITISRDAEPGTLSLKYRGTINDRRDPISSGTGNLDQQGLNVYIHELEIVSAIPIVKEAVFNFDTSNPYETTSITFCFSVPMNTNSVEENLVIHDQTNNNSIINGVWEWNEEKTCATIYTEQLLHPSKFLLTIFDSTVLSEMGVELDGDEDGSPGGLWMTTIDHPDPIINVNDSSQEVFANYWGSIEKNSITYRIYANTKIPGVISENQILSKINNGDEIISFTVQDAEDNIITEIDLVSSLLIAMQNKVKYLNLNWDFNSIILEHDKSPEIRPDETGQTYWIAPPAYWDDEVKESRIFDGYFLGALDGTDNPNVRQDLYEEFFIQLILQEQSVELDNLTTNNAMLMILNLLAKGDLPADLMATLSEISQGVTLSQEVWGYTDVNALSYLFTRLGSDNGALIGLDRSTKLIEINGKIESWHNFFESAGAFFKVVNGVNEVKNEIVFAMIKNSLAVAQGYQRVAALEQFFSDSDILTKDPVIADAWETAKEAHQAYAGSIMGAFVESLNIIDASVELAAWIQSAGVLAHGIWSSSAVAAKIASFKAILPLAMVYHGYTTFRDSLGEFRLSAIASTIEEKMFEELQMIGNNIGSSGGDSEFDRLYYQLTLEQFRRYSGFLFFDSIQRSIHDHLLLKISDIILDVVDPNKDWEDFQDNTLKWREKLQQAAFTTLPPDYIAATESNWLRNVTLDEFYGSKKRYTLQIGEILPLTLFTVNNGGDAEDTYTTVSHSLNLDIYGSIDPDWNFFEAGSMVWGNGDTEITGPTHETEWPMYEAYASSISSGSSKQYDITFEGVTEGFGSIYYRVAMKPGGVSYFVRDPATSQISDQQDWSVKKIEVNVFTDPDPHILSDHTSINLMEGEEVEITFVLSNIGGAGKLGYFDLSHSDGIEILRISPGNEVEFYDVGDFIWNSMGIQVGAEFPLYSSVSYRFPGYEDKEYKVIAKAKKNHVGDHWLKYRAALLPFIIEDNLFDNFVRDPENGDIDQQGWPAKEIVVNINENLRPIITQWNPLSEDVFITLADSKSFAISAYDPNGRVLDCKWWFRDHAIGEGFDFSFIPKSEDIGNHVLRVEVSDGELIDSHEWKITTKTTCDLDIDGDIDGKDLAIFAAQIATGTNTITLEEFSAEFGD